MADRTPKSLCRRLAGSMALVTALLVALTCGTGYWLMARTLLSQREETLVSEVTDRAKALDQTVERQAVWLTALAEEISAAEFQSGEEITGLLAERERTNGNLKNLRLALGEALYTKDNITEKEGITGEEWYQKGVRGLSWLPPQRAGGVTMTIAAPVWGEEENGVLCAEFPLDDLARNVSRTTIFDGGYAVLLDQEGNPISFPQGGGDQGQWAYAAVRDGAVQYTGDYDGVKRYFASATVTGPQWKLVYAIDRRTLLKPLDPMLWLLLGASALSALLAALLAAWRMEALAMPLREMTRAAREMEKGRYKLKVSYDDDDEFGALCRAMEQGCAWTAQRIDELSHSMRRMAQGDFTVKSDEHYTGDFASVGESIDHIAGALHSVFKQVNLTAKWALGGSHQVSGVSGRLSAGIESQSNSVEALGKAATLLRHESNQNALNAGRAQEAALGVSADLRESARQTALLRDSMREAGACIRELNSFLNHVQQAVAQGRMLSISVSAEAERAGEQAAAFAMAVDELRDLFCAAQKAAEETSQRVEKAQEAITQTEESVQHTADAIRNVTKKNGQTAEYMGRIASAAQLQAQAATKMSKEVAVISVVIQSNAQLAEQFDHSCNAFSDQAKTLSNMAAAFYTKGEASEDEKSAPIIFEEGGGGFSVTEEH